MAYSPSRRNISNLQTKRQIYSHQGRHQNYNSNNLGAKSPSIRSPKLNEESQYTKLRDAHDFQEIKIKLETVLKHNSQLLNQNATLSEMVNSQRIDFESKIQRDESQIVKARNQMTVVLTEMKQQQKMQEIQINRLLEEISRLHEEKYRLEVDKNNQLKQVQEKYERDMTTQIRNMKKSNEESKELYELQIKKLKDSIQLKNYEYESLNSQSKNQNDKLRNQIESMKTELKHFHHLQEMQLKELQENHREMLNNKTKQLQRQNEMTVTKLEGKMRKMKQDLVNKNIEIEQAHRKGAQNEEEHQQEVDNLKEQRERLIEEINQLSISMKENFNKEKEKLKELGELEICNVERIAQNEKECLKGEINKLSIICSSKTQEIQRLYKNIADLKKSNETEKRQLQALINNLKRKIKVLEEDSLEEIELLKVKMAQLHEADINNLEKYYTNEIVILNQQNRSLDSENAANREKIHKLLQANDEMRKQFEIELTKYKAKVQDYKVKFAAANLEFREQITSLGTKMQLTSQTLLREAQQKKKGAEFFETQKKKFHSLIENKDKEINAAYQMMNRLKELHSQELKQQHTEIMALKEAIDEKINDLKSLRQEYDRQYEEKSKKLIEQQDDPNQKLHKENKELRDKLQAAEKQIFQKKKQIEFTQKQMKSLQQELGLRAGFLQTMQLESSAAIEDERSKMKIMMNEAEVAMKDYYEAKIQSKDKDLEALREQLSEKQSDIRQLIVKYNQLQKRLRELLEAQQKMSELEIKVMNLGMDENLVKNIGELFGRYRQQ